MQQKVKQQSSRSEKLVQRLNEIFHDLTAELYQASHPEIFEQEKSRWIRICKPFFDSTSSNTVVDLGTGTGFVPLTIAKFLRANDSFICSDISSGILDVAERNLKRLQLKCQFQFVKIDNKIPLELPFATNSVNIVTLNSVLHHINDINHFSHEIDRILKPAGIIFIGHEPNQNFKENKFLKYNFYVMNKFDVIFKKLTKKIATFIRSNKNKKNILNKDHISNQINKQLLEENLIKKPLFYRDIVAFVNFGAKNLKPTSILPNYDLLYIETYNHLFWVKIKNFNNRLIKWYDNFLRRKYPNHGSNFFIVLRKTS